MFVTMNKLRHQNPASGCRVLVFTYSLSLIENSFLCPPTYTFHLSLIILKLAKYLKYVYLGVDVCIIKFLQQPWPVWLRCRLGVFPQSERSRVRFLVRAHAWVEGLVPVRAHTTGSQSMFLSILFSLPFPLSKNKKMWIKINKIFLKIFGSTSAKPCTASNRTDVCQVLWNTAGCTALSAIQYGPQSEIPLSISCLIVAAELIPKNSLLLCNHSPRIYIVYESWS